MIEFETWALTAFVAFCRIGVCLGLAPGFSSPRIPARFRLFISLGLTLALTPTLFSDRDAALRLNTTTDIVRVIASECATGAVLGLTSRFIISALEAMSVAISMSIGVTSTLSVRIDENDSLPELATFIVFSTTALIFFVDLHWTIVRAMVDSFAALPIGSAFGGDLALARIVDTLAFGFPLALRIASPFLAFGLLANLAFALVNKVAPQIAMYFISVPFVMAGGFALLYATAKSLASIFVAGFSLWLSNG